MNCLVWLIIIYIQLKKYLKCFFSRCMSIHSSESPLIKTTILFYLQMVTWRHNKTQFGSQVNDVETVTLKNIYLLSTKILNFVYKRLSLILILLKDNY